MSFEPSWVVSPAFTGATLSDVLYPTREDLDQAIDLYEKAVATCAVLSPERAEVATVRAREMLSLLRQQRDTLYPRPTRYEREPPV